ncbi:MAG: DNA polymerase [Ilumatobacteraceae bacterium]
MEWHDTADLAVYSHLPRALSNGAEIGFGVTLDKAVRESMDGVRWSTLPPEEHQRVLDYALDDAALSWLLWARSSAAWPRHEQLGSLHTGEIEFRGIPVDRAGVERDISILQSALFVTEKRIPWVNTEDEKGKPVALRSKKALDRECLKCGVPPPETTAAKSKEFLDWLDEYGEKVPAVVELGRYRRIDRTLSVYRALLARIRPDGRAALGLKYMGAEKTGRWSGANKFNLQNLMKSPILFTADYQWTTDAKSAAHVIDVRARIVAPAGKKLIIADLSQIEPRVLNWMVGNREFLDLCAQGMSPYEAHARASMGWTGGNLKKEAPQTYALAKARVLALGYGAGWGRFIEMARGYLGSEEEFLAIFAVKPPAETTQQFLRYLQWLVEKLNHKPSKAALAAWPEIGEETQNIWVNSWEQVTSFRRSNPRIKNFWDSLDKAMKGEERGGTFENELPSGRTLTYFDVSSSYGWSARAGNPMGIPSRVYGGLLVENVVQACARDLFLHGILNLETAGHRVLFHVHDEVIVEADETTDAAEIVRLLTQVPDWAKGLPVAAEAEVATHYKK